ncbi:twin-arginine translocation signal domain-containing protein [Thalassiella azotivora]
MSSTLSERIVEKVAGRARTDRRGFLRGATLAGAALAVNPWSYLTRPASAYDAVCGSHNTCGSGYTVFCCTINNGSNTCPPGSFVAGWWKADNASFCGGAARYYIDCNSYRGDDRYPCRCNDDPSTCDNRLVNCNQFRYGQCNTQIPWSQTGPVLCRLVSCVPPWQEYGGVCSTASRTDNNTTSHSAPCLNGNPPVGNVEVLSASGNTVRVAGWAYDRDEPGSSIYVAVYVDGQGVGWFRTDVPRPDVNASFGIGGDHGFDIRFEAPDGPRTVTVYAINVGSGQVNPVLASRTVHVNPDALPVGALDRVTTSGNTVRLQGWAFDPDRPSESVDVAVYVDGRGISWFPTDVDRPDVNSAFRVSGRHGYDIEIEVANGRHTIDVYGINAGPGSGNPLLARRVVEVNPGVAPLGHFDSAQTTGDGEVLLRGWAYDPDRPSEEISVAVYLDGVGVAWFPTGRSRPDVNRTFGITGDHGFEIRLSAPPGVRTFRVHAINVGGGTTNPVIGTRTVTVGAQAGALGRVEETTVTGDTVRLSGWAFDEERPGTQLPVTVTVDGTEVARGRTGEPSPEVADEHGVDGDHGFDVTFTTTPGQHVVVVRAVDGRTNPVISTQDVVVR